MALKKLSGYAAVNERRLRALDADDLSLSAAFAEALDQEVADETGQRIAFMEWALLCPEPKTGTLDFQRFPFQRRMYEEGVDDPEEVVVKATQVGVSARMARKGMYQSDVRRRTTLYIFPTKGDVYDFSDARITPMVERSDYLKSRIRGDSVFNKGLKKLGLGFFYMRGSEKKTALDSVDADCLILDEYDTLNALNIPDAERRISGSPTGMIARVGVPTFTKTGIARLYEDTDQRAWLVRCGACNEWQEIDFWKNVDQAKLTRVCARCQRELDVARGEWVAKFPDRQVKGWHVPRLIVPGCDIGAIVKASRRKEPHLVQVFWNKDLGLPYSGGENRLTEAIIRACQRNFTQEPIGYAGFNPVTAGVDVASVRALNVRISEHREGGEKVALFIGTVDSFDDLVPLMDRYRVNMAAVDRAPERRLAEAFKNLFAGRVYLVGYASNQHDAIKVDEQMGHVSVRPLEAFDTTIEGFRSQRNLLPLDLPAEYMEHLQAPVRTAPIADELGVEHVQYEIHGPCDFFQAEVYDVVAEHLWWIRLQVEEAQRTHLWPLEDQLEGFERSQLDEWDGDSASYRGGPQDEYSPGPDME